MQNRLQRKIEREKGDYKMKEKILDIIEKYVRMTASGKTLR